MPSGSPASDMAPPAAIISMSVARQPLRGPGAPNGVMLVTTSDG